MTPRLWFMGKVLVRNALALLVGIAVAVVLVTLYVVLAWDGAVGFVTTDALARAAVHTSAIMATILAILCVPVWLLLTRFGLARRYFAAALGFLAPLTYWVLSQADAESTLDLARDGFVFGLCGAVAGLATWWVRPRATHPTS